MTETETYRAANESGDAPASLTREDWIDAAWELAGDGTVDRGRIEPIGKKLGVTKGSFYWHFKDRQALIDAIFERWFGVWEEGIAEEADDVADPGERIWVVFERIIRRVTRGQTVSFRLWSHRFPDVAARIEEEDSKRLLFLVDQLQLLGFNEAEATIRGQTYQAVISGEFLRNGGRPMEERLRQARKLHELIVQPT